MDGVTAEIRSRSCQGSLRLLARVGLSIVLVLAGLPDAASQGNSGGTPAVEGVTYDGAKVRPHEFTGDLRSLPGLPPSQAPSMRPYRPLLQPPPQSKTPSPGTPQQEAQAISGPLAPAPSPTQNFPGLSYADSCGGVGCGAGWPPDPNGDVGRNHYIQAVNDSYAIYSKTGTLLAAFTENQLWSVAGASPCNGNSQGDPVALYDALADRWILTHFAFASTSGPFYQCIAASKTSDPVAGGWYFYALQMDPGGTGKPPAGTLNDYPKFGIWYDCLYMAANEFSEPSDRFAGTSFASFSRADLYSGAALTWSLGFISNTSDPFTMIPSNLSGQAGATIPPGTPNYFVSESQTAFAFEVRKFTPGTNCGGGGSLGSPTNATHASYTVPGSNIVPQPNTTIKLDSLSDRLMQRVQYRKVGAAESLWVVHSVQASTSSTVRLQWAQIDVTGQTIATTPVQQQIYAPDTTLYRWMGSLAVDKQGNMAVGYSTSNGTAPNFPSIAYSGRLASDPLNSLPQTESQLVAGAGSQTNNCGGAPCNRWGDYTAMAVDAADDCTFWYTNQYYSSQSNGSSGNWQTRIGSFKFPSCLGSSSTSLASSLNPAIAGSTVTFTATVNGTNPTGSVNFTDGPNSIGGCSVVALSGSGNTRTAVCTTSSLTVGAHSIVASYSGDASNPPSSSAPLTQVINSTSAMASFVGADITTQGNWRGRYGSDGYTVIADSINYPAYAQVGATGNLQYVWDSQPTDVRALQRAVSGRIAATWYSGSSFSVDVNLTDQASHQVALYLLDWDNNGRITQVDVLDAVTQQVLATQTVQSFQGGVYLLWNVQGHVVLRFTNLAGSATNAVLSGIFFGATTTTYALSGTVTANGSALSGVTFAITGAASCTLSDGAGHYTCTVPSGWSGTVTPSLNGYSFTPASRSYSNVAANQTGQDYTATASSGGTMASFGGTDATTQGNWRGHYGSDGYAVIADSTSYPAYAQVGVMGNLQYVWDSQPTDVRALQRAVSGRIAATWYSGSSFSVDMNLTDQASHQVALYLLDWDNNGRITRVDVLDAATQQVLATQTVQSFQGGVYLLWNVQGHVVLRFTNLAGSATNTVLSGIFFGSATTSTTTASFVGADATTQGNWQGHYGSNGYAVIADSTSYPAYAQVGATGNLQYVWDSQPTDVRALQRAVSGRIAATWYSGTSFSVDVNLTDQSSHQLALYLLDWDNNGRITQVDVLDAATQQVLATHTLQSYQAGVYLVWRLQGHVVLRFTNLAGSATNAVLSGIFFDAAT